MQPAAQKSVGDGAAAAVAQLIIRERGGHGHARQQAQRGATMQAAHRHDDDEPSHTIQYHKVAMTEGGSVGWSFWTKEVCILTESDYFCLKVLLSAENSTFS